MKFVRLFFGAVILFFYSGCYMIGSHSNLQTLQKAPCWVKEIACIKNRYPFSSTGSGSSIDEAINDALIRLAKQKEVDVKTEDTETSKDITEGKKTSYSDKIYRNIFLKTNVKIKYWKVVDRYKNNKKIYVLVSLDAKVVDNLNYLGILRSIIDIVQSDIDKIDSFSDLENLKTFIGKGEESLKKIDFNLLNYYNCLKDYENSIFFEHKIKNIKNSIEKIIKDYNNFKNKTKKQQEIILKKLKQQLKVDIKRNCLSVEKKYNINVNYNNGCKIYLDINKTKICQSFCGGNPFIILDNKINLGDLILLKDIGIVDKQLYENRQKLLILKNLTRE